MLYQCNNSVSDTLLDNRTVFNVFSLQNEEVGNLRQMLFEHVVMLKALNIMPVDSVCYVTKETVWSTLFHLPFCLMPL